MGDAEKLQDRPSEEAYQEAARALQVEVRAMKAVAEVESGPHGAFLATGEPVILFERHVFSRLTDGKYDGAAMSPFEWGLISDPAPGGYGPVYAQHRKLRAAAHLDHDAAHKSCSWGAWQVMGFNYGRAGFATLKDFVDAMHRSVDDQLHAFVTFVGGDSRMVKALREKDWKTFARSYNGPGYAGSHYDSRIRAAYERTPA